MHKKQHTVHRRFHLNFLSHGHIETSDEAGAVLSIVAVQVKSQMSKKIVQTYAFQDPGSSGIFCRNLEKRLGRRDKPVKILFRIIG